MNGKNSNMNDFWRGIIIGFCYGVVAYIVIAALLMIGSFITYSNL